MERRLRPSPLPLQGLLASLRLWPWPLQMPRSGLKQVWVLPTAIAQLWEPLAVNSDSATSVTDLPSPQRSPDEGKRGDAAPPCPVLLGRETLQHMCAKQWVCVPQRITNAPVMRSCFSPGGPPGGAVVCFTSGFGSTSHCGSHDGTSPDFTWWGLSQALPAHAPPASKPGTAVLDGHR